VSTVLPITAYKIFSAATREQRILAADYSVTTLPWQLSTLASTPA
jgi:hypothetical protein